MITTPTWRELVEGCTVDGHHHGGFPHGAFRCCPDGCSYCNGTAEVVYMNGKSDAAIMKYLTENFGANEGPRIVYETRAVR